MEKVGLEDVQSMPSVRKAERNRRAGFVMLEESFGR